MNKNKLISLSFFLLITVNMYPPSEKIVSQSPTFKTIYVDDDAAPEWYDETHFKTIMDAINTSNNDDTVLVYNGTYYEKITINNSINIAGEDKYGTIIDGSYITGNEIPDGLALFADYIIVNGFTIQNFDYAGVYVGSHHNKISNNVIKNISSFGIILHGTDHLICNNLIIAEGEGITSDAEDSSITGNEIIGSSEGISLDGGSRNTISWNNIEGCDRGILLFESHNNIIKRNNIAHNYDNVFLGLSWRNKFYENNFIDCDSIGKHVVLKGYSFFNRWHGNYWDNQIIHFTPKIILGRFGILPIPWINIDLCPAREPYTIQID